MTNQEAFQKISQAKKGRYMSLLKKKDLGQGVEKVSALVIRLGVNYANMKVNEGRQTGSLPWGQWVKGYENLVIEHKGSYYLRVANGYTKHGKSYYFLNGEQIDRAKAASIVGEKKLESGESAVYNIKFENILSIG